MLKSVRIRYIILVSLFSLFTWWGTQAFMRYLSQPLTTDISYSLNDNENGIQFPHITFCPDSIVKVNQVLNHCYNGTSYNFITALFDCLKNSKNFNVVTFLSNLKTERETLLATASLWTGENYANLKHSNEYFWSPLFHDHFGPCYSFDLSKAEEFEFVQFQDKGGLNLEFILADDIPWSQLSTILHSKNDFPDAWIMNSFSRLLTSNQTFQAHGLNTRKKVSNRESTRTIPCTEYEQRTCRNVEDNELILSKLGFKLPILYHGHHLDH